MIIVALGVALAQAPAVQARDEADIGPQPTMEEYIASFGDAILNSSTEGGVECTPGMRQ